MLIDFLVGTFKRQPPPRRLRRGDHEGRRQISTFPQVIPSECLRTCSIVEKMPLKSPLISLRDNEPLTRLSRNGCSANIDSVLPDRQIHCYQRPTEASIASETATTPRASLNISSFTCRQGRNTGGRERRCRDGRTQTERSRQW